jgi:NADPH-dependent 2,4-dienoyl-CoA reductase/sulfur reductase-like enzyme
VATGAVRQRPPIEAWTPSARPRSARAAHHERHLRRDGNLQQRRPGTAAIVGGGYIGPEMAEALTTRGPQVTVVEQLPQLLSTVDTEFGDAMGR